VKGQSSVWIFMSRNCRNKVAERWLLINIHTNIRKYCLLPNVSTYDDVLAQ
jgi:hypothetical protein